MSIPLQIILIAVAMVVHELGHLVAAHSCKVTATELGLGFGPRILGFHNRQYSIQPANPATRVFCKTRWNRFKRANSATTTQRPSWGCCIQSIRCTYQLWIHVLLDQSFDSCPVTFYPSINMMAGNAQL
jgi:hypothetical protein